MKTVIICNEGFKLPEPMSGNTVLIPIPKFMETEATSTNTELRVARRMRADKIIIYRNVEMEKEEN